MISQVATISKKVSGGNDLVVVKKQDFEAYQRWLKNTVNALNLAREARKMKQKGKLPILRSLKSWRKIQSPF